MNKSFGLLINGKWLNNKKTIDVLNPFDGKKISSVSIAETKEINSSIKSAHLAFQKWSKTSAKYRSEILKNLFKLTIENKETLSEIITLESGKPLRESKVEVEYGASFIEWSAEQALRTEGKLLESPEYDKKMFYVKRPVGVVVAITPWNFPLAMVTRKVSAAIAAGCSVILKPSELTPLTALKFGELAIKAGLPNGVFNIINGNPKLIGEILSKSSLVKKITFTGSTKVGKLLMKDSSSTVKNISLELGGNAPFAIFSDADLDKAIEGFVAAKFRNAGQTCVSANRLFVEKKIFNNFVEKLVIRFQKLKVGNGMENNDVGPLISDKAVKKIKNHLDDALLKGGKILIGGKKSKVGKLFYEPTIVININPKMKILVKKILVL